MRILLTLAGNGPHNGLAPRGRQGKVSGTLNAALRGLCGLYRNRAHNGLAPRGRQGKVSGTLQAALRGLCALCRNRAHDGLAPRGRQGKVSGTLNAALRGLCALLALFAGAAACSAACFPVTGSRITGRDLAVANPAFAALPATYTVALAPEPGARKTLTAAELNRLAAANHIAHGDLTEICFEMPTRRISEQEVEVAMRRSIAGEVAVELKIVELPQTDMPPGQLEFPLNGLEPAAPEAPGVQLWRGFVRYAETRKAQYWARVTVLQRFTAVVASRDLAANAAVPASALSVEERTGPLQKEKAATRIEDVAGRELKRPIKAGEPIALSALTPAWDVKRGDAVRVEVTSGEARLLLDAVAESPAREGDLVELRNPSSGKVFRARLAKGGLATLVIAPGLVSSGQKL